MTRALPTRLRRRWLSSLGVLTARLLAALGLLLACVLAAGSGQGPMGLVFLTATAALGVAVARAHRATRQARAAMRLHRTVEDALNSLISRGWHLKHNVRWPEAPADGHLAMIPGGELAFAIKDCIEAISDFDYAQTQEFATALSKTGRPYIPICVAKGHDARSSSERGVVSCTPELLAAELLDAERAFTASLYDDAAHNELLYSAASAG